MHALRLAATLASAALTLVTALLLATTATAQKAPAAPDIVMSKAGDRPLTLLVPAGHCVLDRRQPRDRATLELMDQLLAGQNQLHVFTANCDILKSWRQGRRQTLGRYTQVQSTLKGHARDHLEKEQEFLKNFCAYLREQSATVSKQAEIDVNQRLKEAVGDGVATRQSSLGVLGEDEYGCYTGEVMTGKNQAGKPFARMSLTAATVLNGRLAFLYHFDDILDLPTLNAMLAAGKAAAKAHVQANGGHGRRS